MEKSIITVTGVYTRLLWSQSGVRSAGRRSFSRLKDTVPSSLVFECKYQFVQRLCDSASGPTALEETREEEHPSHLSSCPTTESCLLIQTSARADITYRSSEALKVCVCVQKCSIIQISVLSAHVCPEQKLEDTENLEEPARSQVLLAVFFSSTSPEYSVLPISA